PHLSGVDERRQLELGLHTEETALVDVGAELDRANAPVESGEPVATVAAQRTPAADRVTFPEGGVARPRDVVQRATQRGDGVLRFAAQRDVAARVEAELVVRGRASQRAVGELEVELAERALARQVDRISGIVANLQTIREVVPGEAAAVERVRLAD